MKKICLSILLLISFLVFVGGVKAYDKAKAPTTIPNANSLMYGTRSSDDDVFDFSSISFKNGNNTLLGENRLYKIKISSGYDIENKRLNNNWFSAYCLDPNANYPVYGIARRIGTSVTDEALFNSAVRAALFNSVNSENMYLLFKKLNEYDSEQELLYTVPEEYMDGENKKYTELLQAIYSGTGVVIEFNKITYGDGEHSVSLLGSEINELLGLTGENYILTLNTNNTYFDYYKATNMGTSVDYKRVLWIIEHSYPTLSLSRLYEDAGVNEITLKAQLLALPGNTTLSDEEKIDGYVYSTVQYAIWHVLGKKIEGNTIGNELVGSTELNKIYQYLIKDRSIYSTYGNKTFSSTLDISKPSGSEIAMEDTNMIKYGPYTVTSGMVSAGDITLTKNINDSVRIVDANDNEINTINDGGKFYVIVSKTNRSNSIVITASAYDGYTFEPSTNRGRIYYSVSPLIQNVVSGGIIKATTASASIDIMVNVQTGLPNIGLLFIVTLLIFAIGYILIVKMNKKVELK